MTAKAKGKGKPQMPENLFLRGNTWWLRYAAGGRLHRITTGTTSLKEAKKVRNEVLGKRDRTAHARARLGVAIPDECPVPTFTKVATEFLDSCRASSEIQEQSYVRISSIVDGWLVPQFGPKVISEITRADVRSFLADLKTAKSKTSGKKLKNTARIFGALRRVFRYALGENLYTGADPTDIPKRERPKANRSERPTLTPEQYSPFLAQLTGQLHRAALLMLQTGLRVGEAYGLEWSDIDLGSSPRISVRRSYDGPPKNATAKKPIPLDAWTAAQLRTWRGDAAGDARVFVAKGGKNYPGQVPLWERKALRAAAKAAGVARWEEFSPHCLRHSFGSAEYARTGDPKLVQRLMRHASINITLSIYVHDSRGDDELVADRPALVLTPVLKAV